MKGEDSKVRTKGTLMRRTTKVRTKDLSFLQGFDRRIIFANILKKKILQKLFSCVGLFKFPVGEKTKHGPATVRFQSEELFHLESFPLKEATEPMQP